MSDDKPTPKTEEAAGAEAPPADAAAADAAAEKAASVWDSFSAERERC